MSAVVVVTANHAAMVARPAVNVLRHLHLKPRRPWSRTDKTISHLQHPERN
jgi:hypothetical protein